MQLQEVVERMHSSVHCKGISSCSPAAEVVHRVTECPEMSRVQIQRNERGLQDSLHSECLMVETEGHTLNRSACSSGLLICLPLI